MKQMRLFGGVSGIALVFVMVLAGCEQAYNGPSIDEISDAVIDKVNDPTTDEIADSVMDRQDISSNSRWLKEQLEHSGRLAITRDIQAWGQTDAAYTLTVNTFESESFNLPDSSVLTWSGDGNADIRRSGSVITLAEKSDGKSAVFGFTIINTLDQAKTIKGNLTVTSKFDNSAFGTANLNAFFRIVLSGGNKTVTVSKPIERWGQTDAAYTINAEARTEDDNKDYVFFPTLQAPVLYDANSPEPWESALVEWRPPSADSGLTYAIGYHSFPSVTINGASYDYRQSSLMLSTTSTTEKQAVLSFRVTYGDQSISGTVTVKIKKAASSSSEAELENEALEELRRQFRFAFRPSFTPGTSSYDAVVLTSFIDKGVTAFGQTDVVYTITVRGGEEFGDYGTLPLPKKDSENPNTVLSWTTKTPNAAAVLDTTDPNTPVYKVYKNKNGTAVFGFTYTYKQTKKVEGTVNIVVLQ